MVFPGPLSSRTLGTLQTVNHTFPRFQVGGMGDGDTVPAMLLAGSFVLNRRAAGTMQAQGYQMGGSVSGGNSAKSQVVHVHVHARLICAARSSVISGIGRWSSQRSRMRSNP